MDGRGLECRVAGRRRARSARTRIARRSAAGARLMPRGVCASDTRGVRGARPCGVRAGRGRAASVSAIARGLEVCPTTVLDLAGATEENEVMGRCEGSSARQPRASSGSGPRDERTLGTPHIQPFPARAEAAGETEAEPTLVGRDDGPAQQSVAAAGRGRFRTCGAKARAQLNSWFARRPPGRQLNTGALCRRPIGPVGAGIH